MSAIMSDRSRRWLRLALFAAIAVIFVVAALQRWQQPESRAPSPTGSTGQAATLGSGDSALEQAFRQRESEVMVRVEGRVKRLLADDSKGSRHQRFIVELASGHTVLVAHNIDLARRVPARRGERVEIHGQYEWNEQGGVLHWTHDDPDGQREGGWIRHGDRLYH